MGTTEHPARSPEKKKFLMTIHSVADSSGSPLRFERYEATAAVSSVVFEHRIREACKSCQKYGRNLACPPYSPELREYLDGQCYTRVICIRIPREYSEHGSREESSGKCFAEARSILVEELLEYRKRGYVIAGCGSCTACSVCAAEEGFVTCRNPDRMIYSLESLGINVVALAKSCFDIDLDWNSSERSAGFICAIGAVFMRDQE